LYQRFEEKPKVDPEALIEAWESACAHGATVCGFQHCSGQPSLKSLNSLLDLCQRSRASAP
jgi:hypothetical protein